MNRAKIAVAQVWSMQRVACLLTGADPQAEAGVTNAVDDLFPVVRCGWHSTASVVNLMSCVLILIVCFCSIFCVFVVLSHRPLLAA